MALCQRANRQSVVPCNPGPGASNQPCIALVLINQLPRNGKNSRLFLFYVVFYALTQHLHFSFELFIRFTRRL